MKLHQSKTLKNYKRFSWTNHVDQRYWKPRDCAGMLLYWKTCEYFQPTTVLEIGFFEGLTFGLMFESTQARRYLCVDNDWSHRWHFDELFADHPRYRHIEFVQTDSMNLELNELFDLVHIDGDHSYDYVRNDIEKVLPHLHKHSILVIDDMTPECPDVSVAANELLLGQHDFVPFLAGDREIFFHHREHDAQDFLDSYLSRNFRDIATFFNYDYHGFTLLRCHIANFFNDNESLFFDQLTKHDY